MQGHTNIKFTIMMFVKLIVRTENINIDYTVNVTVPTMGSVFSSPCWLTLNTVMSRIMTFRSTTNRIYDGDPIIF